MDQVLCVAMSYIIGLWRRKWSLHRTMFERSDALNPSTWWQ